MLEPTRAFAIGRQRDHVEIDSVQVHRLPLENVLACARVVRCRLYSEDQPVILVLESVQDFVKDYTRVPDVEHLFHEKVDFRQDGLTLPHSAFLY